MSSSFAQILLNLFISSCSSFTWWHSSSNTAVLAHLLQELFVGPALGKGIKTLSDLESSIYHRQVWLAGGLGHSCFSDPCTYRGLSFRACQHHNWGRLIWYACKTGAKKSLCSSLPATESVTASIGCSPEVRVEPFLLILPAQLPCKLPCCTHWCATPLSTAFPVTDNPWSHLNHPQLLLAPPPPHLVAC